MKTKSISRSLLAFVCLFFLGSSGIQALKAQSSFNQVPYTENFDSYGNSGTSIGNWEQSTSDDFDWELEDGETPSNNTGPQGDHTSGSGSYIYIETSSGSSGDEAILISDTFDLTNVTEPHLTFWYHMYGDDINELRFEAKTTSQTTWTTVFQQNNDQGDQWLFGFSDLNSFKDEMQIRIVGVHGGTFNGDISIDDIEVYSPPAEDLDVVSINDLSAVKTGSPNSFGTTIESKGYTRLNQNVTIEYNVNGGSWTSEQINLSRFDIFDDTTFTFSNTFNYTQTQDAKVCVRINPQLTNDPDAVDSICVTRRAIDCSVFADTAEVDPSGNGDYLTMDAALTDLRACGISQPSYIRLAAGTYTNVNFVLDEVDFPGLSATNTLTIMGFDSANTVIRHNGSPNYAAITLDGVDYVTIENLGFEATSGTDVWGIHLWHNADNNTIQNCSFDMGSGSNDLIGVVASDDDDSETNSGETAQFTTIQRNFFTGGEKGIHLEGDPSPESRGNEILYNIFEDHDEQAIETDEQDDFLIKGNIIRNMQQFAQGIYLVDTEFFTIIENEIYADDDEGLYLNDGNQSGSRRALIANNIIEAISDEGAWINDVDRINVWNNTFIGDPAVELDNNNGIDFRNNIVYGDGGVGIDDEGAVNYDELDYNVYFSTVTDLVEYDGTDYTDLASLKAASAPFNENSESFNPNFVDFNGNDFHLTATQQFPRGVDNGLKIDVDGDSRCDLWPTIGADESMFPEPAPNAGFTFIDSVYVNSPFTFFNNGDEENREEYTWTLNGTVVSNDFNYANTFNSNSKNTIKLKVRTCGGSDSVTKTFNVLTPTAAPVTAFIASENTVDANQSVFLEDLSSNGPTSWDWEIKPAGPAANPNYFYANGTSSQDKNPEVIFFNPGVYEVCLTASNSVGSGSQVCRTSYITVRATESMCFANNISRLPTGTLFDDGGPNANYSDNQNCNFTISPCAKEVYLEFTDFSLEDNDDFLRIYDGTDNTGAPLWDVAQYGVDGISGDITDAFFDTFFTATSGHVYVEFETDGFTDERGFALRWTSLEDTIPAPNADFAVADTVCEGIPFMAMNQSSGDYYETRWLPDGAFNPIISDDLNYTFVFGGGDNDIKLFVEGCGGIDSITKSVYVEQPSSAPTPGFDVDIKQPEVQEDVVSFSDTTFRCVDQWEWKFTPSSVTFVNGSNANSQNPQVVFNDTGCYDVKLIAGNAAAVDSVMKTCYINVIDYCEPVVASLNQDIGISNVQVADINNSSEAGQEEYTNFSNENSAFLQLNQQYVIDISRASNVNNLNAKVWIDYNIDGDFDDAGEEVVIQPSNSDLVITDSFSIPTNATLGATRMRIGVSFNNNQNTPCGPNQYGEFEDYRVVISPDVTAPEIELEGDNPLVLEACADLSTQDTGATAFDNVDGNITSQIQISGSVNTSMPGTYELSYNVIDAAGNEAETVIREVIITEDITDPEIVINGQQVDTVMVFDPYIDPFFTVSDNCSGLNDTTVNSNFDNSVIGEYSFEYIVSDNAGNADTVLRVVHVLDMTDPTISLIGDDTIRVEVFGTYTEQGVSVSDNYYNNLQPEITGSVDEDEVGEYAITYSVTDSSGNGPVSVERLVIVEDTEAPTLIASVADTIRLEGNTSLNKPAIDYYDNYYARRDISQSTTGSFFDNFPNGFADQLGEFTANYVYTDGSGNSDSVSIAVIVEDTEAPEIDLVGSQIVNIERFTEYDDDSVVVSDNFDDNPVVTTSGSYFTEYLSNYGTGIFQIVYTAEDQSGNASSVTRNIIVQESTTGIDDENISSFEVYPNPTQGDLTVSFELKESQDYTIDITNAVGQRVKVIESASGKKGNYKLNISDQAAGVYFIRLSGENGTDLKRVVLSK